MLRMLRRFSAAALAAALVGPPPQARAQSPQDVGPYPSAQGAPAAGQPGGVPYPLGGEPGAGPDGAGGGSPPPYDGDSSALTAPEGAAGTLGGGGTGAGVAPGLDASPLTGGAPGVIGGVDEVAGIGVSPGLGGNASVAGSPPGVIGDYQPFTSFRPGTRVRAAAASSRFPNLPTPLPPPTVNDGNSGIPNPNGSTSIIYKLAGLKTADNQSPRPQDRVYYSFNYFDNLNASINRRLGSPTENVQVYHQLFGFEKMVLNGKGSIGLRMPLDTISQTSRTSDPRYGGLGGSKTAVGDLSIIGKYAIYDTGRNFFSVGLQVTAPTGPGGFAGHKYYSFFRDTQIQPYLGYILTRDKFYLQGFSAINVPTTSRDVTLLFNDVALGYFLYRSDDASRFLTAIVPTAEAHLTTPLNHRYFNPNDLATTPDVLNLTFGVNTELRRRAYLSAAYVTPVTGPKPFNAELALQFNLRFGGNYRNRPANFPIIGN